MSKKVKGTKEVKPRSAVLEHLRQTLPDIILRGRVPIETQGLISEMGMRLADRTGKGPARTRIGNRVAYQKEDFLRWLEQRAQVFDGGNEKEDAISEEDDRSMTDSG